MRNARKTFNQALKAVATAAGIGFITGDEKNPEKKFPCLSPQWLNADLPSPIKSGYRMRLVQVEVEYTDRKTDATEALCDSVLEGIGISKASTTMRGHIPNKSWTIDESGAAVGESLGHSLIVRPQSGQGWRSLEGKQQKSRRRAITIEVHYKPS